MLVAHSPPLYGSLMIFAYSKAGNTVKNICSAVVRILPCQKCFLNAYHVTSRLEKSGALNLLDPRFGFQSGQIGLGRTLA